MSALCPQLAGELAYTDRVLVEGVLDYLEQRDLAGARRLLLDRVFGPAAGDGIESARERVCDDRGRLAPFTELLVHDVIEAASADTLTRAEAEDRIVDAVRRCGF